ncbi:MAG: hypothetical protein FJ098_11710, partial [Deltaproteobacteria bacterium]|nr:hypothetical protein [Deltaproteobacteria bacterium]
MIPATAHFIWFGAAFPWVHLLALRSAALRGGFARVVLHHADDLRGAHWWPEAAMIPGFEARPIDPDATFRAAGVEVAALRQLWQDLE